MGIIALTAIVPWYPGQTTFLSFFVLGKMWSVPEKSKEIMLQRRKDDLEFYKLFAGDEAFKASLMQSMQRIVAM